MGDMSLIMRLKKLKSQLLINNIHSVRLNDYNFSYRNEQRYEISFRMPISCDFNFILDYFECKQNFSLLENFTLMGSHDDRLFISHNSCNNIILYKNCFDYQLITLYNFSKFWNDFFIKLHNSKNET